MKINQRHNGSGSLPQAIRYSGRAIVSQRGFALIATISVMVLLVMIALAMLSLSTITLRSDRHDLHTQKAKANARLALMLAIGELQMSAGPDQRVTAEGMIDEAPGVGKSHWVGVWSSVDADNDGNPDGDFIKWLVSSPTTYNSQYTTIQSPAPPNDPEWIQMVGNGSADIGADTSTEVLAERVAVMDDVPSGTSLAGHYAWWVGDEGVKARVDLQNTQQIPQFASQGAQRASIEVLTGFESADGSSGEVQKIVSNRSLRLLTGATADAGRTNYHDTTVHSLALQTDTRHGGLKKDLSLLFEMSDVDFEALAPSEYAAYVNENTPISASSNVPKGLLFHDEGIHGPTMDLLRNHYRQYKGNIGGADNPLMVAQTSSPNKYEFGSTMWRRTACIQAWHYGLKSDPNTDTRLKIKWWGGGDFPATRLLSSNVTPYLNRAMMYFSVQADPVPGSSPAKYNLLLKLQPIIYVHNPYNVKMKVDGMRYLKNISQSTLWISKNGAAPEEIDFTALLDANNEATPITSGNAKGEAQFIVPGPVTFDPGEVKIFVPDGQQKWGAEMQMTELGDSFQPADMALTLDLTYVAENGGGDMGVISQIPTGTEMKMSLQWANFAKEDFEIYENSRGGYNTVWSAISRWRPDRSTGGLTRDGRRDSENAPSHLIEDLQTITPIIVEDRFVKPLKFDRHGESGTVDLTAGYPSFVLGNPLCSSDSNNLGVFGMATNSFRMPGSSVYSTMSHSHMDFAQVGYPYFQNAFVDSYGTWGSNNGAAGERYTTVLEVPTAPLFSLGCFQHANIAVEGYQPGLAIANSFPNLTMDDHSHLTENIDGMKNYDLSYMANRALWDTYFFSSITPRPSDSSYASLTADTSGDIDNVIGNFVTGQELLGNSRMRLLSNSSTSADTTSDLKDYRKSAAHLGVAGGFNINSTSVDAWKSFLSGFRNSALRYNGGGSDSNEDLSAFPRMTLPNNSGVENPDPDDQAAWLAYAQLSDTQIEKLAQAIVEQVRNRAKLRNGSAPVTPALTMGQFVNRMLTGGPDVMQRGTLQAAIKQSEINSSMDQYGLFDSNTYGAFLDQFPEQYPFNGDGASLEVPLVTTAPTTILQSDILQTLGAAMTPRSDTFTVRAYGDSVDTKGVVKARAWCEAVVQRVSSPVHSDIDNVWQPVQIPSTNDFGRRLKVISFRWLAKDEI